MERISINIYCNRPRSNFTPNYDENDLGVYYTDIENISPRKENVSKRQSSCTSFELFRKITEQFSKQEEMNKKGNTYDALNYKYNFDSKQHPGKSAVCNKDLAKTLGASIFACFCLAIFGVGIFLTIYTTTKGPTPKRTTVHPTIQGIGQYINNVSLLK